LVSERVHSV
jgi:hypothetical protein